MSGSSTRVGQGYHIEKWPGPSNPPIVVKDGFHLVRYHQENKPLTWKMGPDGSSFGGYYLESENKTTPGILLSQSTRSKSPSACQPYKVLTSLNQHPAPLVPGAILNCEQVEMPSHPDVNYSN